MISPITIEVDFSNLTKDGKVRVPLSHANDLFIGDPVILHDSVEEMTRKGILSRFSEHSAAFTIQELTVSSADNKSQQTVPFSWNDIKTSTTFSGIPPLFSTRIMPVQDLNPNVREHQELQRL